jgi:hypothetical protein
MLALLLRIVRSSSGIYVVFAAGQGRQGHDPHVSWHRDGRFHSKSFSRMNFPRRQRQQLDTFQGSEGFVGTSVARGETPFSPDCDPQAFDEVMEIDATALNERPNPRL